MFFCLETEVFQTIKALKSKNDKLENEINRSRRQTGPKNSKDFTLVGTSKAGGIDAGLRQFFINFYFGAKTVILISTLVLDTLGYFISENLCHFSNLRFF